MSELIDEENEVMDFFDYEPQQATYYELDDNRFWSIAEAKFVKKLPEGAVAVKAPDEQGRASVQGLHDALVFYGYELGELASDEDLAKSAREKRDALIAETDFKAMPDYPLSDTDKAKLLAYRQALRDIPSQKGFPRNIVWPEF